MGNLTLQETVLGRADPRSQTSTAFATRHDSGREARSLTALADGMCADQSTGSVDNSRARLWITYAPGHNLSHFPKKPQCWSVT